MDETQNTDPDESGAKEIKLRGRDLHLEVLAALLLALSGLGTSWAGYQSARWDGEQAAGYARSGNLRVRAGQATTIAGQLVQVDIMMFGNWLNAYAAKDDSLSNFYRQRFRPEFRKPFEEWYTKYRAGEPQYFAMPSYHLAALDSARAIEKEVNIQFEKAQASNELSDRYLLNAVVLATVMFFVSVAQSLKWGTGRFALLILGSALCFLAIIQLIRMPII